MARFVAPSLIKDFNCHLTDICPPNPDEKNYHQADLCDFGQVSALFSQPYDAVVHLAIASKSGSTQAHSAMEVDPSDAMIMNVNLQGTYNLYEAACKAGVKKIVYISSLTVHLGERHRPRYDSRTPTNPRNLYACTKLFGENLAQVYSSQQNVSIICLRIGQPYPFKPTQDNLWRDNKRVRSFYVANDDITQAIRCALDSDLPFGIFNIVSASDNQRVDVSEAKQIGYSPKGYFSDEGFRVCEEWERPSADIQIVTHDL